MTVSIPVALQSALTDAELRSLRIVVGAMIPASEEYGVPGADDDRIFADIASSVGRDEAAIRAAFVGFGETPARSVAIYPPGVTPSTSAL